MSAIGLTPRGGRRSAPDPDHAVDAGGGEASSIWGESDGSDRASPLADRLQGLTPAPLPKIYPPPPRRGAAAARKQAAIRREGGPIDVAPLRVEEVERPTRHGASQPDRPIIEILARVRDEPGQVVVVVKRLAGR